MKNKLFIAMAALVATVGTIILPSCSQQPTTIEYDIPTYEDNKDITIGVWNGSHHDLSDMELDNLRKAGVNLLVGDYVRKTPLIDFIDRCAEFDLDIIPDQRPWNGTRPEFYDRENFLGFCVYDEPFYDKVAYLKEMREKYEEVMPEKKFFINLNPSYGNIGTDFETYISAYINEVGLKDLSYDNYSLLLDSETEEIYLREDYLFDFDIASHYAKEAGVPLWYSLLTSGHISVPHNYTNPTVTELEWQMYLAMTYGSTYLLHFIYSALDPTYIYPIVDMDGNPTDTYYKVKEANATIRSWDHIYMNFEWLGTTGIAGENGPTGLLDYLIYDVDIDEYGALVSAKSSEDVVIGQFKDANGNAGFMVTNVTNPVENKTAQALITLSSDYKGALVIKDGEESIVALKDGVLSIDVAAGSGMFVIPLKQKA